MKQILITVLLSFAILAGNAQTFTLPRWTNTPCGTWQAQPEVITEWVTVDTLGNKDVLTGLRDWIYDAEKPVFDRSAVDLMYRPCGRGGPDIKEQYRVCSLTGIRQKRQRIVSFKYIEPTVSDYERAIDSLSSANRKTAYDTAWFTTSEGIRMLPVDSVSTISGSIYIGRQGIVLDSRTSRWNVHPHEIIHHSDHLDTIYLPLGIHAEYRGADEPQITIDTAYLLSHGWQYLARLVDSIEFDIRLDSMVAKIGRDFQDFTNWAHGNYIFHAGKTGPYWNRRYDPTGAKFTDKQLFRIYKRRHKL